MVGKGKLTGTIIAYIRVRLANSRTGGTDKARVLKRAEKYLIRLSSMREGNCRLEQLANQK